MGRPIGTNQTSPINGETHWQALNRDIMHHLIIAAL